MLKQIYFHDVCARQIAINMGKYLPLSSPELYEHEIPGDMYFLLNLILFVSR